MDSLSRIYRNQALPNPLAQRFWRLRQWCIWRSIEGRKLPLRVDGKAASIAEPATWCKLPEARIAARRLAADGIMLALTPELRLLCVDLDDCVYIREGQSYLRAHAVEFLREAQSYAELSPSGRGLHVWLELGESWQPQRSRLQSAEIYTQRRFVTVTGRALRVRTAYVALGEAYELRKVSISEAKRLLALLGYSESEPTTAAKPVPTAKGRLTPKQAAGILAFLAAQHPTSKNRNSALYWAALRLREAGVTQQDAEAVLVPIVAANGLPQREALRTIASAYGSRRAS